MGHLEALEPEISAKKVTKDKGPEIPDMGEIPDRGATHVEADLARLERDEVLQLIRQVVMESEHRFEKINTASKLGHSEAESAPTDSASVSIQLL
jgi:hypothetical protein